MHRMHPRGTFRSVKLCLAEGFLLQAAGAAALFTVGNHWVSEPEIVLLGGIGCLGLGQGVLCLMVYGMLRSDSSAAASRS